MKTATIAVAGKGGTGKTTTCALMVRYLIKNGLTPILAVDADPNTNLAESLGSSPDDSIGGVLADFMESRASIPQGMTKEAFLELKLNEALEETSDIDFLVMGRKEGQGCYCYPNAILKNYIDKLSTNYRYVIVDNEAGMECLSRKTIADISILVLVSDHSVKGLRAARRINELVDELKIEVEKRYLILNRYNSDNEDLLRKFVDDVESEKVFKVPDSKEIVEADARETSFLELSDDIDAVKSVNAFMEEALGEAVKA